jgi:hypothetical protein
LFVTPSPLSNPSHEAAAHHPYVHPQSNRQHHHD